jgi:hypothetical protein
MRRLIPWMVLPLLLGGTASIAEAPAPDQPDRRAVAAIDKLMAASAVDAVYDDMIPRVVDAMMPLLIQNNTGKENEIRAILRDELLSVMTRLKPAMKAKSREVYLKRFTPDELEEIVRLSETPLGKKMNKELPQIEAELFAWGQAAGQAAFAGALPHIIDRMKAANLNTPKGT